MHGVEPLHLGRWRFGPVVWTLVANLFSFFSLLVYLRHRRQIMHLTPDRTFAFQSTMLGVLLCSMIPMALAFLLMVWLPVDRCNTPERLRGLERALNRPSNHITFVHAKSAVLEKINPFNHEQLCRGLVDIEYEGQPREENAPMWFRVLRYGEDWGSKVSTELQKNEEDYQLRRM